MTASAAAPLRNGAFDGADETLRSWEYANRAFNRRKADYASEIRAGRATLPAEVVEELAPARGSRLLHVMCNDGREAAYLGHAFGVRVCGVDFSPAAIAYAETLSERLGLANEFFTEDVFAFLASGARDREFDSAFITLGSLRWAPELTTLFRGLARCVRPGGSLVIWEFHPLVHALGDEHRLVRNYPLKSRTYLRDYGVVDYVADPDGYRLLARADESGHETYDNPYRVVFSEHSFGGIVRAATDRGEWSVVTFAEYAFSWEERCLPWLAPDADGRFVPPPGAPQVPLTFLMKFERRNCGEAGAAS